MQNGTGPTPGAPGQPEQAGTYARGPVHREPGPPPDADPEAPQALTFPDLPRLELDQLLTQVVDRAQEVIAAQCRLRGLLRASHLVVGDLTMPTVLRRIVEAARELVGARYAALGVISPAGGLAEFVHIGMPENAVDQIGHLPQGKGLLGALIDDPRPIRLRQISDDERSCGLPPGHPPMKSFLGVPIRVRDEIFGNLYLTESAGDEFTADDEELISAIAATASVAIDNARLYESARRRGEWLQASAGITRRLLSPTSEDATRPLQLIAEHSCKIADADLVTVALPTGDGDALRIELAVGTDAAGLPGTRVPLANSPVGEVFTSGRPLRLARSHEQSGLGSITSGELEIGPMLIVPLLGSRGVQGVLTVARALGRTGFSADDLDMAGSFANHAAIAIELAEARAEQQHIAMLAERDRIAADLHDHVIQRLFAAGLSLQSVAMGLGPGPMTDRVLAVVADLDTTISQIRTTIFQLQDLHRPAPSGLRSRLLEVAGHAAKALGFEPAVRFAGPVDTLPADVADDLVAVMREALANVARHAEAHNAEVDLVSRPDGVTLAVRDDGRGMPPITRRSGLANLHRRAEHHGGALDITPRDDGGTVLTWSIPHG